MTTPVIFASAKQFLGLAKETVHGTPVAPSFTMPVEEFSPDQTYEQLKDPSWRGHMGATSDIRQGVTKTEFDLKGPVFLDGLGHLLLNILGDHAVTGTAPYSHEFAVLNSAQGQPPSHTFTHFQGPAATVGARRVSGACLSDLTLKWSAESELFTLDGKGTGWGTSLPPAAPTAAPSTVPALASWRAALGIGGPAAGGTLAANVAEAEISIKRALKPYYTLSGSQNPYIIARGTVEVTGKLTFVAKDEQPFLDYLNHAQPQLQLDINNGLAGASALGLVLDISKANYTSSKFSGGNEAAEYEVEFEAISTAANAGASAGMSPCQMTVTNAVATY
jgi:hypothetical protein